MKRKKQKAHTDRIVKLNKDGEREREREKDRDGDEERDTENEKNTENILSITG